MDYTPRQVMALTRGDFKNEVLRSHTIWLCASCYACTVECPREIRITDIMYELKQRAIHEGIYPKRFPIPVLAREFSEMVKKHGRITEMLLVMKLFLKTNPLAAMGNWRMGIDLMKTGPLLAGHREDQAARRHCPHVGRHRRQERSLSMKYSYFPGCSLKGLGRAYEESLLPVMKHLGVELQELDDWNCCGATAYMAVDEAKACVLAARNLALAEKSGNRQILAPCAACYLVLNKTKHYFARLPGDEGRPSTARWAPSGLRYSGNTPVRHPLDVLVNDVGLEAIKQKVRQPLKGLKVAPYYGCQIVRPYATFDDQYNPTTMDRLLEALGATVVRYPLKTKCCGGSLTGTVPEAGHPHGLYPPQGGQEARRRLPRHGLPALPVQPGRLPRPGDGRSTGRCWCRRSISRN